MRKVPRDFVQHSLPHFLIMSKRGGLTFVRLSIFRTIASGYLIFGAGHHVGSIGGEKSSGVATAATLRMSHLATGFS